MKRILLDHCVPRPLRHMLWGCSVSTAKEMNWEQLKNGQLLNAAEAAGFEVLITSDKNLRYQQNLTARRIAIIELPTNNLKRMPNYVPQLHAAIPVIQPGAYVVIS